MELQTVRIFVDVMKHGSFAAVARRHGLDPSAVSRWIASLETELGFRLFQRTTRKLSPTEAGNAYFARVAPLVDAFDQASEQALDLVSQPAGTLRVTACTSFGQRVLAPLLPKLRAAHPQLTLELVLSDDPIDLLERQIDVAIRFGVEPDGDVAASRLVPRRFRVCASPAYLETHGRPAGPADLEHLDCLCFSMPGYRSTWKFRKAGEDEEITVPVSGHVVVSHGMTMTACAVASLGPALLPDWLCRDEIDAGLLVDLFPDHECAATRFDTAAWIVYPSREYVPLKARVFVDFLRKEVAGFA